MKIFLACILLALVINSASAGCSYGSSTSIPHKWSQKLHVFCEYQGMKFMKGSNWVDAERCQRCRCTENGLSCCGIGYYAGIMRMQGCVTEADHCDAVFLNAAKNALCEHH